MTDAHADSAESADFADSADSAPLPPASLAVIGGSGLYRLFDPATSTSARVATPYGPADVTVGTLAGRSVAFLTRHGVDHSVAPHSINYRANIWALARLGVRIILSSSAVGGVSPDYPPGTLVLTDQFIDRTHGRPDTFYDQGSVQHLAAADPFSPQLHTIARRALDEAGEQFAQSGTVVVIQGPRFSTRAESLWFRAAGAHTINMTMYPEVALAAELNIESVNLSFVTDSDAGLAPLAGEVDPDAADHHRIIARLMAAQPRIVRAIETIIRAIPHDFEGREQISADEVAAVLDRAPLAPISPSGPINPTGPTGPTA